MNCSKCNQNKKSGKVVNGEFICTFCNKKEKAIATEGIIRYGIARYTERPLIVSAKYRETNMYWVRIDYEKGWPHDAKIHKTYHGKPPGYDSKQEAFDAIMRSAIYKKHEALKYLQHAEENIAKLFKFAKEEGYSITLNEDESNEAD